MDSGSAKIIYYFLQWTFGLPQNLIGLLFYLFTRSGEKYRYRNAAVKSWRFGGSMGLGMFIFMGEVPPRDKDYVLRHEYGHTVQSIILGPLFLPVIGLPSLLWASLPVFRRYRASKKVSYYALYTEKWANRLGGNGPQKTGNAMRPGKKTRSDKKSRPAEIREDNEDKKNRP